MVVTVFVFGRPGSGKSTVARCLEMVTRDRGESWSVFRINDYKILDSWFRADKEHITFRPREYDGFDILVPEIYDEALKVLKREVQEHKPSGDNELIIIEFARCDYQHALELLGTDFIKNAYFLFLEADIKICMQRVNERVRHPSTLDDHFASEFVFECYKQGNYVTSHVSMLKTVFGIDDRKIRVIDNSKIRSKDDLLDEMKAFVRDLAESEVPEFSLRKEEKKHTELLVLTKEAVSILAH